MPTVSEDLVFRALLYQETPGLRAALDSEPLTAYHGIDPSADSLHIGNLYGICTLRRLQDAGHRPIAVAGGGTGLIGDPGGRDEERPMLSRDQHAANMAGIRAQMERLLDFDAGRGYSRALLVDNADWLVNYRLVDFLRDIGKHFTVNQMVAKESVRSRFDRPEQGISFTEFSYMLLQACDYLHLYDEHGCRLQFGGSDQWGNITMGVELIRKARQAEAHAFTWPLLLSAEGRKYGKSTGNAIWLDPRRTPVFSFYQHFLRVRDDEVGALMRFLTFLGHDEILALDEATAEHPGRRGAQRALARAVTSFVHGPEQAAKAERAALALFSEEITALDEEMLLAVLADAPTLVVPRSRLGGGGASSASEGRTSGGDGAAARHGGEAGGAGEGLSLVDALVESGLVSSRSAARAAIEQGGAYVNNSRRTEASSRITRADLLHDHLVLLRRGRRDYCVVRFE
jgi:tyrosyl-tRNA synthetase